MDFLNYFAGRAKWTVEALTNPHFLAALFYLGLAFVTTALEIEYAGHFISKTNFVRESEPVTLDDLVAGSVLFLAFLGTSVFFFRNFWNNAVGNTYGRGGR